VSGGLCPNHFDPIESAPWDAATDTQPWYRDCTPNDPLFANGFDP